MGKSLMADPERQVERKIKEAILALRLDGRYTGVEGKERILEMYMNQSYYGNQAYGIWAAANAYFGKDLTSDKSRQEWLDHVSNLVLLHCVTDPTAMIAAGKKTRAAS